MKNIFIAIILSISSFVFGQKEKPKMTLIFTLEYNTGKKIDSIRTFIFYPSRAEVYSKNFVNSSDHFVYIYDKFIKPKMVTKSKNVIIRDVFIKDSEWQKEQEQIYLNKKSVKNE